MTEQTVVHQQEETSHYDFRGGRWWVCDQVACDGTHHYFVASPDPR